MTTPLPKPIAPASHLPHSDAGAQSPAHQLPARQLPASLLIFLLVVAMHATALAFMVWGSAPKIQELVLPTVQGMLITAPLAETIQMPKVQEIPPPPEPEPKPEKIEPKKVEPKPKLKPVVEAPPSEKAISQEEVAQEETAPPPAQSSPPAKQDDTQAAPITPPQEDADHLDNPKPGYPSLSHRLREQGTVILEVLILPDGSVGEIRIKESSGYKRLDDTAVKAVKQWKYIPARRGNEPIAFWYLQPLEFSLK